MHFGLFFLMQRDPDWSEEDVYDAEVAQMVAAEAFGFESVWIAEHHFSDYGLCPVPPVLAASVAARTRMLRVGMGVSLLPLHDPILLAEQLAVLDQVSGGRLDVGIGRGQIGPDYETFGASYEESRERVEEGIELMHRAWLGEAFSFDGRFRRVERLRVVPRPRQRPHPPLFIAANSPDSVVAAARLGLPTLSSFFIPASELAQRHEIYRAEVMAWTGDADKARALLAESWGMRCVYVAPDRATALAAVEGPFMAYQQRLSERANVRDRLSHARLQPFASYIESGRAIFGSPDEVAEGLARYAEETGYQRILLLMALAGLPAADTLRSMELFATRVLPQLRSRSDTQS